MRPYYKTPQSVLLAEAFLKFMKENKDYDHHIPKLEDALKHVNQILAVYSKQNDNYLVMFLLVVDLHHILLEIIDVSNRIELNKLRKRVLILVLTPESNIKQLNNASLTTDNILINVKKNPDVRPEKLLIIDRISMVIHLRLSLDPTDYNFGGRLAALLDDIPSQPIPANKRTVRINYKYRHPHQDESKDIEVNVNDSKIKVNTQQADQPHGD